jgi:hypothetical protein
MPEALSQPFQGIHSQAPRSKHPPLALIAENGGIRDRTVF